MPRAWPSLSVALASLLTKVASTAASSGAKSSTTLASPSWIVTSRSASETLSLVATEPQADVDQAVALDLDHAPAGAAEPRIDAEDANRAAHDASVIDPPPAAGKASRMAAPAGLPNLAHSRAAAARQGRPEPIRDRTPRQRNLRGGPRRAAHLCRDGGRGAGRRDARLLRLRRRDGLHAADRGDLRSAHRRRHHPAGRFRLRHAVRHPGGRAAAPGARSARSRSPWRSGLPLGVWLLLVLDPIVLRWCIAAVVLEPACRCWRRAGAITARRGCRSPSASACSPASARARC